MADLGADDRQRRVTQQLLQLGLGLDRLGSTSMRRHGLEYRPRPSACKPQPRTELRAHPPPAAGVRTKVEKRSRAGSELGCADCSRPPWHARGPSSTIVRLAARAETARASRRAG